jgi:hypothetical protein
MRKIISFGEKFARMHGQHLWAAEWLLWWILDWIIEHARGNKSLWY